jgi:hypothetical protein
MYYCFSEFQSPGTYFKFLLFSGVILKLDGLTVTLTFIVLGFFGVNNTFSLLGFRWQEFVSFFFLFKKKLIISLIFVEGGRDVS